MTEKKPYPIRRALISVSDKTGLIGFAASLQQLDIEIVATGGTATALRDAEIPVTSISDITSFPEILEGRVKTLHPKIHGALLAKLDQKAHAHALETHGIAPIGLIAINLYPFEKAAATSCDEEYIVENIDIGGPAMLRAAAKNYGFVTALCDPADYDHVVAEIEAHGGCTRLETRRRLAGKVFSHTAAYDGAVGRWFSAGPGQDFPETYVMSGRLRQKLRYGENPHQPAALYADPAARHGGVVRATQLQGKELSYNNIADADAALALVSEFGGGSSAVAIIKHANPCGVGLGETVVEAYRRALACDPVSAFGGVVALNETLDEEAAQAISRIFTEVVLAPDATDEAKDVFAGKPNLRLLLTGPLPEASDMAGQMRSVQGGFLVQGPDAAPLEAASFRVVTARHPTEAEMRELLFAFKVAKHVKSNAIVFAKGGATIGIGAGQMSRVDSVRIAVLKAGDAAKAAGLPAEDATQGAVVASDAFLPFADGLHAAADAGAVALIQPGGSMRDEEVIAAADQRGVAMVFTGVRHFRH